MRSFGVVRCSGTTAVTGGLLWVVYNALTLLDPYVNFPSTVSQAIRWDSLELPYLLFFVWLLFWLALTGLIIQGTARTQARVGLFLATIGAAGMTIGLAARSWLSTTFLADLWILEPPGTILVSIGFVVFGVANIRDRVFPRWNAVPLIMALVFVPGWMIEFPSWAIHGLLMLFGFGWVLLGYALLVHYKPAPLRPDAARRQRSPAPRTGNHGEERSNGS